MKSKVFFLIPISIAAFVLTRIESELIVLKDVQDIKLGTLFLSFPIILALTERFNEVFVVSKKTDKSENIKKTSLASFSVGVILAIAGFRILENFMSVNLDEAHEIQHTIFTFIDTVLTAVVIAGGTDGWHQLVALLQDITKAKRKEVKLEDVNIDKEQ